VSERQRIGVYVCWCGGNISDVVDVKKIVEEIRKEPDVVVARDFIFMCSEAGQKLIINDIKELGLTAVVVASCSPKLHEATFRNTVVRAGLNPYMYYHANIREQVSWAHSDDKEEATRKAVRHVRMAVAYLRHAKPLEKIRVNVTPSVLVIGGGVSGIRAAVALGRMGLNVYLVEKEPFLGGNLAKLDEIYPYNRKGWEIVASLIQELKKMDNIAIYTNAKVKSVAGFIGNFEVEIEVRPRGFKSTCERINEVLERCGKDIPDEWTYGTTKRSPIILPPFPGAYPELPAIDFNNIKGREGCLEPCKDAIDLTDEPQIIRIKVGSIITATGFRPYTPSKGEYGYGEIDNVVTLNELHALLRNAREENGYLVLNGRKIGTITFIYCVGSRALPGEGHTYCSRYCCNATIYTALRIAEKYPKVKMYHLYRDIRTYGKHELLYEKASGKGMVFIKYGDSGSKEDAPKVLKDANGNTIVKTKDLLTDNIEVEIPSDLVVLVVGMEPNENKDLNQILKLPIGPDGFYQEVHPKLKPVETTLAGFFIAGTAQGPKDTSESVSSALAAAAKAAGVTIRESLELEPFVAKVDPEKCNLSKMCISECPYGAISIKKYDKFGEKAWVNPALCKGCGACVAVCPTEAIQLQGLTNDQIIDMIKAGARG
jgi:heterodisulfide reductase subunit A